MPGRDLTLRPIALPIAAVLAVAVLWFGRDALTAAVIVRLMLPALWVTLWSLACLGAGRWLVRWARVGPVDPLAELVISMATGAAVLSLLATVLGLAQLLGAGILIGLMVAACCAGVVELLVQPLPLFPLDVEIEPWTGLLVALSWCFAACCVTTPPVMFDVIHYHLAFPMAWLQHGGIFDFPRHAFSYFPLGHGMAYLFPIVSFGVWGASATHAWFGAIAVLCALILGQSLGGRKAGWWAAAVFALTPAVLECLGFAIADLAVAGWGGAALVVLTMICVRRPENIRSWVLAGFLCGAALSAKYLALVTVALPIGAFIVLHVALRGNSRWRLKIALFGITAVLVVAPWLLRNTVLTGNPTYPYLQEIFGGPPCLLSVGGSLDQNADTTSGWTTVLRNALTAFPLRIIHPLREGGVIGLQWLILLPMGLAIRKLTLRRDGPLVVLVVVGVLAWGALVQFARFLLPVLVPAAAFAGVVASRLVTDESRVIRSCFRILLIFVLAWNTTILASELSYQRLGVAIGRLDRSAFLESWVSYQPMVEVVNQELEDDAVVLMVAEPRCMYLERMVLVEDSYRLPWLLELAEDAADVDELAASMRALGATHVLVNEGHMQWSARLRHASGYWQGASDEARQRALEFLRDHVEVVADASGVWVGRIEAGKDDRGG